jgi:hypothetical protein
VRERLALRARIDSYGLLRPGGLSSLGRSAYTKEGWYDEAEPAWRPFHM